MSCHSTSGQSRSMLSWPVATAAWVTLARSYVELLALLSFERVVTLLPGRGRQRARRRGNDPRRRSQSRSASSRRPLRLRSSAIGRPPGPKRSSVSLASRSRKAATLTSTNRINAYCEVMRIISTPLQQRWLPAGPRDGHVQNSAKR